METVHLMRFAYIQVYLTLALWLPVCALAATSLDIRGKQLLTHPSPSSEQRIDDLNDYLSDATAENSPASFVLTSHARLQLAALLLQQGDYGRSRAVLMALPQKSPVAVPAALLLAQTWLAEKNHSEAVQWYLRTIQRYPFHPQALAGLLDAAALLKNDDTRSALTLYETSTHNSLEASAQLQKLLQRFNQQGLSALILKQDGIHPAVRQQLMHSLLLGAETNPFDNSKQAHHFTQKYRQLLAQLHALQQSQIDIARKQQQLHNTALALGRFIKDEKQQITRLKRQLDQQRNSSLKPLRKQLVQLSNALRQHQSQYAFLQQNQAALPDITARLHDRLETLLNYTTQQRQHYASLLSASLQTAAKELDTRWHNLAARGQLEKAELLRAASKHQYPAS